MEFGEFVSSLKPFTMVFLIGKVLMCLVSTLQLINPFHLVLFADWRLLQVRFTRSGESSHRFVLKVLSN